MIRQGFLAVEELVGGIVTKAVGMVPWAGWWYGNQGSCYGSQGWWYSPLNGRAELAVARVASQTVCVCVCVG